MQQIIVDIDCDFLSENTTGDWKFHIPNESLINNLNKIISCDYKEPPWIFK